ncbi:Glycosylated lysosomal membrane protein [Taenia crassiceps]|uniref:Glycosylated lysosomal membrane protein n=1 Tax=Taenia crassiceps TaxID=6207 RepID=A0ABR4Q448_9CEST
MLLYILITLMHFYGSSSQLLSASLNPGCDNCSNISVISVVYRGGGSSVHFIVSITKDNSIPSVFLARSDANASVQFNWPAIFAHDKSNRSVILSNSSFYGLLFPNLYQYEDRGDVADISRATGRVFRHSLDQCFWFLSHWDSVPNETTGLLSLTLHCNDSRPSVLFANKGFIELQFTLSEKDRLADDAPHTLIVGGLAVRVMVTLRRLALRWKETRWALNLVIVANHSLPDGAAFENFTSTSIDDEPSPGVFKDMALFLENYSYVAWRSVCYIDATARDWKSSRAITVSPQWCVDKSTNRCLIESSLLPFVYGPIVNVVAVRQVNVSFGDSGDGFYASSNYIDWVLTFALGKPPPAHHSPLIWSMVFISITMVSAALCVLVCFIGYHLATRRRDNYEEPLLAESEDHLDAQPT